MTNLEVALKYLPKGWPVISINPTTKKPCLEAWKEFQNRLPTEEEVTNWWTKWPWASIGLVTGKLSGISAIDVDPRHGGTEDGLPETVKSQTGGGGFHYFYQYNPQIHSQNGIREGVDLKSDGGYIILPPSEHKSGNKYKWITPPFVNEFKQLPRWILDGQQVKKESTFDSSLLQGVSEGRRNESAASVIGKILHGLKEKDWQSIGWQTVAGWNLKNNPPLEEMELLTVFNSIASREATKDIGQNTSPMTHVSQMSRVFVPKLLKNITTSDIIEMSWVWGGFLIANHTTLLSAYWKSGKSTLLTQLLKALETGTPFLGKPTTASRVLVISEESETIWYRRRTENELAADTTWILSQPVLTRFKPSEWLKFIEDMSKVCETNNINLVVFDTISTFWPLEDESNASAMQNALLPLNRLTKAGLALLLIHHFRKAGGVEGLAARGSGALGSAVDILVDFSRPPGDESSTQRHLKCLSRFEETPREVVCDYQDGEYVFLGSPQEVQEQKRFSTLKDILLESGQPMTAEEIREAWDEEIHGKKPKTAKTIKRNLSKLLFLGEVKEVGSKKIKGGDATLYLGQNKYVQGNTSNDEIVPTTLDIYDPTAIGTENVPLTPTSEKEEVLSTNNSEDISVKSAESALSPEEREVKTPIDQLSPNAQLRICKITFGERTRWANKK